MRKAKRCIAMILTAVLIMSAAPMALASNTTADGISVPFCTTIGTTVQEVLNHLNIPDGWVSSGTASDKPLDAGDTVATGMVVHGPDGATIIAVLGDVLGTGKIGLSQLIKLAKVFANVQQALTGAFLEAGDLNGNGVIDIADLTMLAVYVVTGEMPSAADVPTNIMQIAEVSRRPLIDPFEAGQDDKAREAAKGANDFAFRMSSTLLENQQDKDANFVCSPYSVWLPLAALVNATDDEKRPELLESINAAGLSADEINTAASRMLYGLTGAELNKWNEQDDLPKVDPLKIANAVFVDRDKTISPEFAEVFASDYLGDSISVDFASGEAADAVNKWCSNNTNGLIPEIIEEFGPDTVAAIANAIYFSDRWDWEFNPDETKDDVFHSPSGDVTSPFMLREGDALSYYEDDTLQAMPLKFKTDGGLAILLPKDGDAESLLSSLTDERLSEILNRTERHSGKLLLPRFDLSSDSMNLMETLNALGVPLLDSSQPSITKLLTDPEPLFISDAVQSAKIKVDEKGTTAAAVTVISMDATSALIPQPEDKFEMNCNKPFVFVLYGRTFDGGRQVLFTGIVNQPEIAG